MPIIEIFTGGGVSKLSINCTLILLLFQPLIQIWPKKRLNGHVNGMNNGLE